MIKVLLRQLDNREASRRCQTLPIFNFRLPIELFEDVILQWVITCRLEATNLRLAQADFPHISQTIFDIYPSKIVLTGELSNML